MHTFSYRAARYDGEIAAGTLDAATADEARHELSCRGLFIIDVRQRGHDRQNREGMSAADLALGLRALANLLDAGLPMTRALDVLEELAPKAWRDALPAIGRRIREGASLAAALESAPVTVSPLVIGIVRAGEAGSGIASAVRHAADLTEASATTRAAIRAALMYPLTLVIAGIASIGVLVGIVLPRFAAILSDFGQRLPPATRFVLDTSVLARRLYVPGTIAIIGGFAAWRAWATSASGRRRCHEFLHVVPVLGSIRRSSASARAAFSLSALIASGVPLAPALIYAAHATGDAAVEQRLLVARDSVLTGSALAQALDNAHALTDTVVRLVRAGEETGRLAEMLSHAAKLEQNAADQLVHTAVRVLEPALILMFAGVVGLVAAALLQAIYSVRPGA